MNTSTTGQPLRLAGVHWRQCKNTRIILGTSPLQRTLRVAAISEHILNHHTTIQPPLSAIVVAARAANRAMRRFSKRQTPESKQPFLRSMEPTMHQTSQTAHAVLANLSVRILTWYEKRFSSFTFTHHSFRPRQHLPIVLN